METAEPTILRLGTALQSWQSFYPRENDTIKNSPWAEARLRVAIVRLSPFSDVEESVTHQVLFSAIKDEVPDSFVDFAFMPGYRDQRTLDQEGVFWPLGIVSTRPLSHFDVVFFSVSYVLEIGNIPFALEKAGISRFASERKSQTLILAGGSSILLSQGAQPYLDGLYFGECEASSTSLMKALLQWRTEHQKYNSGRNYLASVSGTVPGLYIPGQEDGQIARIPAGTYQNTMAAYPLLNGSQADTVRLQISLGCPYRCSFCYEGFERKPYRDLAQTDLSEHASHIKKESGARSIDVLSFNFNTHKDLFSLLLSFSRSFKFVHVMSQRLDILWRDPYLQEAEAIIGKRSFTLGVEGISSRIRSYFQKDLHPDAIQGISKSLLKKGLRDFKFFYIISSRENNEDFEEFADFLKKLAQDVKDHGGARVLFSCGVLMVMPHTPLQHGPIFWSNQDACRISDRLQELVEAAGFEYRLALEATDWSLAQYLASADSQDAFRTIEQLYHKGLSWSGSYPAKALTVLPPVNERPQGGLGYQHPLGFVHGPEYQEKLRTLYVKLEQKLEEPEVFQPTVLADSPPGPKSPQLEQLRRSELAKRHSTQIQCSLFVPQNLAGASSEWLGSWAWRKILRELESRNSPLVHDYPEQVMEAREMVHGSKQRSQETGPFWWGQSLFNLEVKDSTYAHALKESGLFRPTALVEPGSLLTALNIRLACTECDPRKVQGTFETMLKTMSVVYTTAKTSQGYQFFVAPKTKSKSMVKEANLILDDSGAMVLDMHVNQRFSLVQVLSSLRTLKGISVTPAEFVALEFKV